MQTQSGKLWIVVDGGNNLNGLLPLFVLKVFESQVNDFLNEAVQKRVKRDLQREPEKGWGKNIKY